MKLEDAIEHLDDILQPDKKWECKECRDEHVELRDWLNELRVFKDLEKQGKLVRLPCAMGDTVYRIQKCQAPDCQVCGAFNRVDNCFTRYRARIFKEKFTTPYINSFGKTIFLTKQEAVNALKNQRSGENKSERDSV